MFDMSELVNHTDSESMKVCRVVREMWQSFGNSCSSVGLNIHEQYLPALASYKSMLSMTDVRKQSKHHAYGADESALRSVCQLSTKGLVLGRG